jgi:hypothetical protein
LDVKDEESDEVVERMGCYVLNETAENASLLDLLLTNELAPDTVIMLVRPPAPYTHTHTHTHTHTMTHTQ